MAAWDRGFAFNHEEQPAGYWMRVTQGALPADLVGTYFRNGPGRFSMGPDKYDHPYGARLIALLARERRGLGELPAVKSSCNNCFRNEHPQDFRRVGVGGGAGRVSLGFLSSLTLSPPSPPAGLPPGSHRLVARCRGGQFGRHAPAHTCVPTPPQTPAPMPARPLLIDCRPTPAAAPHLPPPPPSSIPTHKADGDGLVTSVSISGGRAYFRSRFIRTPEYQLESAAQKVRKAAVRCCQGPSLPPPSAHRPAAQITHLRGMSNLEGSTSMHNALLPSNCLLYLFSSL